MNIKGESEPSCHACSRLCKTKSFHLKMGYTTAVFVLVAGYIGLINRALSSRKEQLYIRMSKHELLTSCEHQNQQRKNSTLTKCRILVMKLYTSRLSLSSHVVLIYIQGYVWLLWSFLRCNYVYHISWMCNYFFWKTIFKNSRDDKRLLCHYTGIQETPETTRYAPRLMSNNQKTR